MRRKGFFTERVPVLVEVLCNAFLLPFVPRHPLTGKCQLSDAALWSEHEKSEVFWLHYCSECLTFGALASYLRIAPFPSNFPAIRFHTARPHLALNSRFSIDHDRLAVLLCLPWPWLLFPLFERDRLLGSRRGALSKGIVQSPFDHVEISFFLNFLRLQYFVALFPSCFL